MKENRTYEKPNMKFVSTRNEEAVANVCWGGNIGDGNGNGNHGTTWYYDTKGEGYVSFQICGGSCTLNLYNVTYYDKTGKTSKLYDGDAKYEELEKALVESGGESGNPFKGEGAEFPTTPDEKWS